MAPHPSDEADTHTTHKATVRCGAIAVPVVVPDATNSLKVVTYRLVARTAALVAPPPLIRLLSSWCIGIVEHLDTHRIAALAAAVVAVHIAIPPLIASSG